MIESVAGVIASPMPRPATRPAGSSPSRRFIARATLLSAALSIAGAVLGLGRDQALAHLFGAGAETDAFLAWEKGQRGARGGSAPAARSAADPDVVVGEVVS